MQRQWLTLVIIVAISLIAVFAWDTFITATGYKSTFNYTNNPIENRIFDEKIETLFAPELQ
jgi:hypothetical protein